nr:hypothetical protein [Clostridia bacterium]
MNIHTQDYYELYQLLGSDSKLFYFIDDKIYEPNPGDVLIIRPGIPHASYKAVGARYIRVHIRIPMEVMDVIAVVDPHVDNFLRNSDISLISLSDYYAEEYAKLTDEIKALTNGTSRKSSLELLASVLRQLRILYLVSKDEKSISVKSHNELIR